MKKLKIFAIILCIIALVAIITGLVLKKDKVVKQEENVPIKPSIIRQIKEEKCSGSLCINTITIEHAEDEEGSSIQFVLENRGIETIEEGVLNIIFDNGVNKFFSYPTLKSNEKTETIVIFCSNEEIQDAKSFDFVVNSIN